MIWPVFVTASNLTAIHCVFQFYSLIKHFYLSQTIEILQFTSQPLTAVTLACRDQAVPGLLRQLVSDEIVISKKFSRHTNAISHSFQQWISASSQGFAAIVIHNDFQQ